ncbi:MAG: helix-turn-helix domain-containing protein [Asgard group archaeon]|nr:helix-turn-helix domain-containing protein [Asgard group archaeon]
MAQRRRRTKEKRLTLLLHPLRREIYRIVCETPGLYFFELSSELTAPHGTVNWHLRKLEEANLIKSTKFGGKRVYFSRTLRSEDVEKAFVVLKHSTARKIFIHIINNEECHQTQIAKALHVHHDTIRHHTLRMETAGLVESFKDGRKTCYRLGEVGLKIQEESINTISSTYVAALMDILEENCLHPEIEEVTKDHLTLRIECPGKEDATFSISLSQWTFDEEWEDAAITQEEKKAVEET